MGVAELRLLRQVLLTGPRAGRVGVLLDALDWVGVLGVTVLPRDRPSRVD